METMVNGLLEAEQLDHRQQALNLNETDINSLILDIITTHCPNDQIQPKFKENKAKLYLDAARIQFVIKNLLGNALKYRKQENDKVTINSHQTDKQCVLVVEDSGVGIPQEHIPHLTEPFYRVDPSRLRGNRWLWTGILY